MKLRWVMLLVTILGLSLSQNIFAHEVRPAYLQITESSPKIYEVFWKVPAQGDMRLAIHPNFPQECKTTAVPIKSQTSPAYSERKTLSCSSSLLGQSISIEGLEATKTDVLVRFIRQDGTEQTLLVNGAAPSFIIEASPSSYKVASTYLILGIEHILFGIDHLLFVLALLLLVKNTRRLIATVTAFTLAHSFTLALATLGFVHVPQQPVEAVIALSIIFVASEILRGRQGHPGMAAQWPWIIAFVFGLLHGFGFAGALSEVGLPQQAIPLALLFFNLGVEIGQLLFIASVLTLIAALRRSMLSWPQWVGYLPAQFIGVTAAFWTIERVVGFWF